MRAIAAMRSIHQMKKYFDKEITMENQEMIILEECPMCRGTGMIMHEGGWNVQVECTDCGSHRFLD